MLVLIVALLTVVNSGNDTADSNDSHTDSNGTDNDIHKQDSTNID